MVSSFVLKTLAGALRKQVLAGGGLGLSGNGKPRVYKPWRLWRAFAWGLGVAVLAQAGNWHEIYERFATSNISAAASDLIGRVDVIPVIFVLAAAFRNAVMKRRPAKT